MDACNATTVAIGSYARFAANSFDGNGPLASLIGTGMMGRFHFWRGGSERRYTVSVATIDPDAADHSLPDFDGFVLIPVIRHGAQVWPLDVLAIERSGDRHGAIAAAAANGASEWHVHLLGSDRAARLAVVADLKARHFVGRQALSA